MTAEFYLSILAMFFGVAVVVCVFRFGHHIYWSRATEHYFEMWATRIESLQRIPFHDFKEIVEEYLERRNKFWELFGQVTLSIVVVVLLTGLLLMDKIGADAGLPILSAIVAFVVGKGIGGSDRSGFVGRRGPE